MYTYLYLSILIYTFNIFLLYMDKTPNLLHLIIGFFSVFIFLYRAIVLMVPMINDGIQKNNYITVINGLTMLV